MSSGDNNKPPMNQQQPGGGGGLSQSAPLVTLSSSSPPASVVARGIAMPVGDNHPLAAAAPSPSVAPSASPAITPAPLLSPSQQQQQHQASPYNPGAYAGSSPAPFSQPLEAVSSNQIPRSPRPTRNAASTSRQVNSANKSLDDLANEFLSARDDHDDASTPIALRPSPLPPEQGIARLRTLVERRAWGDVLKISASLLNSTAAADAGQPQHGDVYASLVTPLQESSKGDDSTTIHDAASDIPDPIRQETIEIMTLQCHAWLKLRRYAELTKEVETWNFVMHHDLNVTAPDWLPWSIQILAAQSLQFSEDTDGTSDALFALRERIPATESIWLASVDHALANLFLRREQWRLTMGSLDRMVELVPDCVRHLLASSSETTPANQSDLERVLMAVFKCEIWSRQGRVLLQAGALPQVAAIFEQVGELWSSIASIDVPLGLDCRIRRLLPAKVQINQGLFHFANGNYDNAELSFQDAIRKVKSIGSVTMAYDRDDFLGPVIAGSETVSEAYGEATNNVGLCRLYSCKMADAVHSLEQLVRKDPTAFLTERIAFNLCTLYELGADTATSARRKRVLQLIAKRFFLHDIGPESFRVT